MGQQEATLYLRNKLMRHIEWNGQEVEFFRNKRNEYEEIEDGEIAESFKLKGLFHDGGGYGGMLNIQIYEREGAKTVTRMKPMLLCSYEDGLNIKNDDWCMINEEKFIVVDKVNVKAANIAFDISFERDNTIGNDYYG